MELKHMETKAYLILLRRIIQLCTLLLPGIFGRFLRIKV